MSKTQLIKTCNTCGLTDAFPGVKIVGNECNYCVKRRALFFKHIPSKEFSYTPPLQKNIRNKLKTQMEKYFLKLIIQNNKTHGVLAYSGGVDSTYTLDLMVNKYKLNIIPVTVDTGFLNKRALENITYTIKKLNIKKHIIIGKHKRLFSKATGYFLKRLDLLPIRGNNPRCCMVCHHIMDLILYGVASKCGADFIVSGLDRFQTPPELNFLINGESFFSHHDPKNQFELLTKTWPKDILNKVLSHKDLIFLRKCARHQIKIITPTWLIDYDKDEIANYLLKNKIIKHTLNTNCYFAPLLNFLHKKEYGFGIDDFTVSSRVWEKRMKLLINNS